MNRLERNMKRKTKFKPTHRLPYDRGVWIKVIYNEQLGIAIDKHGAIFNVSKDQLKPLLTLYVQHQRTTKAA